MDPLLVAAFYQFTVLDDHAALQAPIEACCEANDVRGIILLASEGINSTIAGPRAGVMAVLDFLRADPRLADLTWKESSASTQPFRKMRVRLKKEIVTMGMPDMDPCLLVGHIRQARGLERAHQRLRHDCDRHAKRLRSRYWHVCRRNQSRHQIVYRTPGLAR